MRWRYHMIEKSKRLYIYAYSRESDELDGLIVFDVEKHSVSIMRPSKSDESNKKAQSKAVEHFRKIVDEGFPDDRYICCG